MADEILRKLLIEAKQKPRNFVLAVNGKDIGIILSKKKISPAQVKEAKIRAKNATKFFTGIVESGPKGLVFKSLDAIPTSALPLLKSHVAEETKITLKATFDQVASLTEVDEVDERFAKAKGTQPEAKEARTTRSRSGKSSGDESEKDEDESSEEDRKSKAKAEALRKKISGELAGLLKVSKERIAESKTAKTRLRTLKVAMDENRWEDAGKALLALRKELA